jgi:hypothetical protein
MEYAKYARYLVSEATWGTASSITASGAPRGNVFSFSDGDEHGSTGIPVFLLMPEDATVKEWTAKNDCSLSITLKQIEGGKYCKEMDTERPTCSRITVFGSCHETSATNKDKAAHQFYYKHPYAKQWPTNHDFQFWTMNITSIWMIDFYGPHVNVPIPEYLNAI